MYTALAKLIIAQAYRHKQLSRVHLAAALLEVTPVSVSKWLREEGDNVVPWKHNPALAKVLGVPLSRILDAAVRHIRDNRTPCFQQGRTSEVARRYKPHFVWAVARVMDLGERKSPASASDLRESHSIR